MNGVNSAFLYRETSFETLPQDLLKHIFKSFLDGQSLFFMGKVNHVCRKLSNDDTVWKELAQRLSKKQLPNGLTSNWKGYCATLSAWMAPLESHILKNENAPIDYCDNLIAIGSKFSTTFLLDFKGKPVEALASFSDETRFLGVDFQDLTAIAFPEKTLLFTGEDSKLCIWKKTHQGWHVKAFHGYHTDSIYHIQTLDAQGHWVWKGNSYDILTMSYDWTWRLWNSENGDTVVILDSKTPLYCGFFLGEEAVISSEINEFYLYNLKENRVVHSFVGHDQKVNCLQVEQPEQGGNKILYSGSDDGTIRQWSIRTGACLQTFTGHQGAVLSLYVTQNLLFSASYDRTIKIWNKASSMCLNTLIGHTEKITCLKVGPQFILSAADDKTLRIWQRSKANFT